MLARVRRLLVALFLGYGIVAGLLLLIAILRGDVWAFMMLLASPLALALGLYAVKRALDAQPRGHLPAYLSSRAIHTLVNEWNEVTAALARISATWGTRGDLTQEIEAVAAPLDPHVGRVRSTGFWKVRESGVRRVAAADLGATQHQWREARARIGAALAADVDQRIQPHAAVLGELRRRGLSAVSPTPGPSHKTFPSLLAHLDRMAGDMHLAAQEAADVLSRSAAPADTATAVRIRSLLADRRPLEAARAALDAQKPMPAPPRPRGGL